MNTKLRTLATLLALLLVLALAGCIGFGDPLDAEDQEKIDQQIRESIEKTFPLPEQVLIRTHVGDDLRFSTELGVDEVVAFYRETYSQKGYVEEQGNQILTENAALLFKKEGEQDVVLEITKIETGSEVHLLLRSPAP